jgi:hypothetical protein
LAGLQGFDIGVAEQRQTLALAVGLFHCDDRIIERIPRPRRKMPENTSIGGFVCHPTSPLFVLGPGSILIPLAVSLQRQ